MDPEPRRNLKPRIPLLIVFTLLLCACTTVFVVVYRNSPANDNPPAHAKTIVLGTPVASFHNVTLQVYKKILEDRGYQVTAVTAIEHAKMYPFFTGAGGAKPYVDMVVSSDLPNNHATWLKDYTESYDVVGTCYELLSIFLAAPAYSGISSLSDAAASTTVEKTIIGFDIDPCARCPDLAQEWISKRLPGFSYKAFPDTASLNATLTDKIAKKAVFLTTMWAPTYWNAVFPALKKIDMEEFEAKLFNQGKALIRKAAAAKFDAKTLSILGAVFLGTDLVNKLDYSVYTKIKAGSTNAPEEAALEWIAAHRDIYDMFSW